MWASDETNLFCEILADPVKNFMENLEREALKKHSAVNYLITLLQNLKKAPKILKQKRKKPNLRSKWKRFFEKLCNKSITIIHFSA